MPERCVDASIAVKWFIKGEVHRQKALQFLHDSQRAGFTLIAPPLFEMEIDSIIQTRVVEERTTFKIADRTLALVDTAPVFIVTHRRLRKTAREIARQFNQRKVYDSTYAALADLRGCDFWTADKAFFDAVSFDLPFVHYLLDYK